MGMIAIKIDQEPKRGEYYLAFDTAWFSAFYSKNGVWWYGNKQITPTHWMYLPQDPC